MQLLFQTLVLSGAWFGGTRLGPEMLTWDIIQVELFMIPSTLNSA